MNWLDDSIPLYAVSWMDAGPSYHFAAHGRLGVLVIFLSATILPALNRQFAVCLWFGVLMVATFNGFPLELTALALLASYTMWVLWLSIRHREQQRQRAVFPALGLAVLVLVYFRGWFSTESVSEMVCRSNLRNLATAVEMYGTDHHLPPQQWRQILEGNYLKSIPRYSHGHLRNSRTGGAGPSRQIRQTESPKNSLRIAS